MSAALEPLIVKALTVWQPHAAFIAHFGKDIENRGWMLNYRGPVIIHAGKQTEDYPELWAEVSALFRRQGHAKHADLFHRFPKRWEWLCKQPRGAAIAVATLADCTRGPHTSLWARENAVHWALRDVEAFKTPETLQGHQGLWNCEVHRFTAANYEHVRAYIAGQRRK